MDLLKKIFKFEDFHKPQKPGFGKSHQAKARASRAHEKRLSRKEKRHTELLNLRRISSMETSIESLKSPAKTPKKSVPKKPQTVAIVKDTRFEMLLRWRQEKAEKLKKEKENKKPIFKPGGAKVNAPVLNVLPSFAPKNSTFKAPKNIKPIPINSKKQTEAVKVSAAKKVDTQIVPSLTKYTRVTRSQSVNTTLNSTRTNASKTNTKNSKDKTATTTVLKKTSVFNRLKVASVKSVPKKRKSTQNKENIENPESSVFFSPNVEIRKRRRSILTEASKDLLNNEINKSLDKTNDLDETNPERRVSRIKTRGFLAAQQKEIDLEDNALKTNKSVHKSASIDNVSKSPATSDKKSCKSMNKSASIDNVSKSPAKSDKKSLKSMNKSASIDNVPTKTHKSDKSSRKSMNKSVNLLPGDVIRDVKSAKKKRRSLFHSQSSENSLPLDPDAFISPSDTCKLTKYDTPAKETPPNVYISPFVTTARGKGSAKKENKIRQSLGYQAFSENTPEKANKAAAVYFHNVLDNVIERLMDQCKIWDEYKENETLTSDAVDMIDVATGQTHLLINKKFQQFRNLINNCQNKDGEGKVTPEDLQGFWDMVYIQVTNLDERFNRLEQMKTNNWADILPVPKKVAPGKKRAPAKPKPTAARSNIREAIKAARLKSNNLKPSNDDVVFNGGFFVVKSPIRKSMEPGKTPNSKRKSLLTSVLSTEAKRKMKNNSPGLTMLKLSRATKSVGKLDNDLNQTMPTPGKSILKKPRSANAHNVSKVVLFKDDDSDLE